MGSKLPSGFKSREEYNEYMKNYLRDYRRRKAEAELCRVDNELLKELQYELSLRTITQYQDLSKVTGVGMDTSTPNTGVFSSLKLKNPELTITNE